MPNKEKTELIEKFPPPQNCGFLQPPKLNNQFKQLLNVTGKEHDERIVRKQEKLQACVGGLSSILTSLSERDREEDLPMITNICSVIRLIIDSMRDETAIRRSLILANTNQEIKDTLLATEADEMLFGEKLSEDLKQAKITGQDVQILAKKSTNTAPKNTKALPRQQPKSLASAPKGQQRPSTKTQSDRRENYSSYSQSKKQLSYKKEEEQRYRRRRDHQRRR